MLRWRVKEAGQENQMMLEKLLESSRSKSPEMNHGLNVTDNAAQTKGAERRTVNGMMKLTEEKQMTPVSNKRGSVNLQTGLSGLDQANQNNNEARSA